MEYIQISAPILSSDLSEIVYRDLSIKLLGLDSKNDMIYSYTLPKYIYDNLVDTEPEYQSYQNYLKMKSEYIESGKMNATSLSYLKKTIDSSLISSIVSTIQYYSSYIYDRLYKKELLKTKKIFVRFIGGDRHSRCDYNGAYMGKLVNSSFQYFIGYEVTEPEKKSLRNFGNEDYEPKQVKNYYTLILHATGSFAKNSTNFKEGSVLYKLYMNDKRDDFINAYNILDWSQTRQDFFDKIQEQFISLNASLGSYLTDLDDDKVDLIMSHKINTIFLK